MLLRSSLLFVTLFTLTPVWAMHSDSDGDYEEQSKKRPSKCRKVEVQESLEKSSETAHIKKEWSDHAAAKLLMGLSPQKNVPQTKRSRRLRGPRSISSVPPSAEDRAFLDALWAEIEKAAPGALPAAKAAQPRVEGRHGLVRKPRPLGERTRRGSAHEPAFMLNASGQMSVVDESRRLRKRPAATSQKR